jgi:hypothetical protein
LPVYGGQATINKYCEKVKEIHVIKIDTTTYIMLEHNTRGRQHHKWKTNIYNGGVRH